MSTFVRSCWNSPGNLCVAVEQLFFGNVAILTDSIKETLNQVKGTAEEPWIVSTPLVSILDSYSIRSNPPFTNLQIILDFSLIVSIDSSAAHAIVKLKSILLNAMYMEITIFVTDSPDGFPCPDRGAVAFHSRDQSKRSSKRTQQEAFTGSKRRICPLCRRRSNNESRSTSQKLS